jgi:hypothetical protein
MISSRSSVGRASSPGANVAKSRRRCGQLECAAKVLCGGARTHRESQVGECQPQLSDPVTPNSVSDCPSARPPASEVARRTGGFGLACYRPGLMYLLRRAACVATVPVAAVQSRLRFGARVCAVRARLHAARSALRADHLVPPAVLLRWQLALLWERPKGGGSERVIR